MEVLPRFTSDQATKYTLLKTSSNYQYSVFNMNLTLKDWLCLRVCTLAIKFSLIEENG